METENHKNKTSNEKETTIVLTKNYWVKVSHLLGKTGVELYLMEYPRAHSLVSESQIIR